MVTLVLSGALAGGCDDSSTAEDWSTQGGTTTAVTNNTYWAGHGYYHAPYRRWYPYPYNYYRPGLGYYHGGIFTPEPEVSHIAVSRPLGAGRAANRTVFPRESAGAGLAAIAGILEHSEYESHRPISAPRLAAQGRRCGPDVSHAGRAALLGRIGLLPTDIRGSGHSGKGGQRPARDVHRSCAKGH